LLKEFERAPAEAIAPGQPYLDTLVPFYLAADQERLHPTDLGEVAY
jgi:hypothetical protein